MAEYIDKQKLMKNFGGYDLTKCQKYGNTSQKQRNMSYDTMMMYEIAEEIDCAPAADVAPVVHSKWEICCDGYYPYCKRCRNEPQGRVMTQFCPNCGAKMDKEVNYDD